MIPLLGSEDWDAHLDEDVPSIFLCPQCEGPIGDGDRVHFGECGRCRRRRRR